MAARNAYYAYTYPDEHGPYLSKQAALHGALMASYWHQAGEADGEGEWGSMIYVDQYGMFWFTDPKRGVQLPDGSWFTSLYSWTIQRPGSHVVMVEHTHPSGMYDPTGTENGTDKDDNGSDYPMFVVRADDTLWYFPPQTHRAIYYGVINAGQVQTKFTTIGTTGEINLDADVYGISANQGKHWYDADYSWIGYGAAIMLITAAAGTVIFLIAIGALSNGSMPHDGPIDTYPGGSCSGPFCWFPSL